jgi:hypothetical protein
VQASILNEGNITSIVGTKARDLSKQKGIAGNIGFNIK